MTSRQITAFLSAIVALATALTACGSGNTADLKWTNQKGQQVGGIIVLRQGDKLVSAQSYKNFIMQGEVLVGGGTASLAFHRQQHRSGYEVLFHNGPIDGTRKTGSLAGVRNLYRSLAADSTWTKFSLAVQGKNIVVKIGGTVVVDYTEPEHPYRTTENIRQRLAHGPLALLGRKGTVMFRDLEVRRLLDDTPTPQEALPAIDEQHDSIIRLQQRNFPVVDFHVHLKGGLTKEQAHRMSMSYGINYGVAPNAGEGGVGRMLANDKQVYDYYKEVKPLPFLMGVQGEGRRWSTQFSQKALGMFDYLFTDAMTIVDRGRICRIYHPEEVHLDGRTKEQYMDLIVDQIVKILTNEPADIYANATYIPDDMQPDYDRYWTQERIDRVLDVLQRYHIALEINARYKIPSLKIIRQAKQRGIKFTFGTNNVDANFGKLEYVVQAIHACGITPDDVWFPSQSIRAKRKVIDYNHFGTR